jgi:hypothetical protein
MDSRSNRKPPRPTKTDPLAEAGFVAHRGASTGFKDTFPAVKKAAERTGFQFTVVGFDD